MNILFVTHDFDSGGAARSLRMLAPRMHEQGHRIEILTITHPRPEIDTLQVYSDFGIKVTHLPFPWVGLEYIGAPPPCSKYPSYIRKIHAISLQKIKNFATDIACFNGYPSTSLSPYIRAKRKVLIAREVLKTDAPLFDQSIRMLRRTINKAIAIGPVELSQLRQIGIDAEMIFNSSKNPPAFVPPPPSQFLHLGCFGKICQDKGQDLLLIACAAIKNRLKHFNAHIHLYGRGDASFLATLASIVRQNDLQELVTFHGWVTDVEGEMAKMHCIVRPDRTGSPWGRDIIEAMSLGRPVLASGKEEIFVREDETGWLFRPNDPAHLAQRLLHLCSKPQRINHTGKAAFNFARNNFDPNTNARRVEHILSELLQTSPGAESLNSDEPPSKPIRQAQPWMP